MHTVQEKGKVRGGYGRETETHILRFRSSERWLHWAVAVPFMVCWISGFILMLLYNPHPQWPLRAVFAWLHRLSGAGLVILPIAFFIKGRKDFRLHLYNIRTAWAWSVNDLKWIALMLPAAVSRRFVLPDQNKFNAAEKINFMTGMIGLPLLIVTGVLIWTHQSAWLSWIVHSAVAIVMTPLILGHILMATVNPDTKVGLSGMISGYVNRQWAKHHYALWYREFFENAQAKRDGSSPVYRPLSHRLDVDCPECSAKLSITHSELTEAAVSAMSLDCPVCRKPVAAMSLVEDKQMLRWILDERKRRGNGGLPSAAGE